MVGMDDREEKLAPLFPSSAFDILTLDAFAATHTPADFSAATPPSASTPAHHLPAAPLVSAPAPTSGRTATTAPPLRRRPAESRPP